MKNIWVVCSYFNFNKSLARLNNLNIFRDNIKRYGLKLLCVEFSPLGNFEICSNDVDMLLQLSDGDIMWQKERLINIGIDLLPHDTNTVIICDADVIFTDDKFIEKLEITLNKYAAVQCFSSVNHLKQNINATNFDYFNVNFNNKDIFINSSPGCIMTYSLYGNFAAGAAGYIWAFRYEAIKNVKLFESNIIGSGDRVSASAFLGLSAPPWVMAGYDRGIYYRYLELAKNNGINRDTVGYIDIPIYDLFHGLHADRRYNERHNILKNMQFNIEKHLIKQPGAPFKFSGYMQKPHRDEIKNYFYSRNEM